MTSSARISAIAAFCKELRHAREYQRFSLREVAAVTRVALPFLEAMEEGRWNDIPRPYVRGYLGLYAHAVGMNRDKVLKSFDRLMAPETQGETATLDEAPPLLKEPQAVGLTRAKIRTTWFAVLSRNRKLLYLLSFLAVAGLFGLLHITRKIEDRRIVPALPFCDAVAENRTKVTSPLTIVAVGQTTSSVKGDENWIEWIGNSAGRLWVTRDYEMPLNWHFDAYDTIKIQYVASVTARVVPAGSARAYCESGRIPVGKVIVGDTAVYSVKVSTAGHADSTKIVADSLVRG